MGIFNMGEVGPRIGGTKTKKKTLKWPPCCVCPQEAARYLRRHKHELELLLIGSQTMGVNFTEAVCVWVCATSPPVTSNSKLWDNLWVVPLFILAVGSCLWRQKKNVNRQFFVLNETSAECFFGGFFWKPCTSLLELTQSRLTAFWHSQDAIFASFIYYFSFFKCKATPGWSYSLLLLWVSFYPSHKYCLVFAELLEQLRWEKQLHQVFAHIFIL